LQWSPASLDGAPAARVTLVQRTAPYRLPLDLEVASREGAKRTQVLLRDSVQSFVVPAPGAPTAVRLDPDHRVMLWEPSFGPIRGVTRPLSVAAERAWIRDELTWLRRSYGVGRVDVGVVRGAEIEWTSVTANAMSSGSRTAGVEPREWTLGALAPAARRLDPAAFPMNRSSAGIRALATLWSSALATSSARSPSTAEVMREMQTPADSVTGDHFRATARGGLGFRLATKRGAARLSFVDVSAGRTLVMIGYPGSSAGCVVVSDTDRVGVGLATQIVQRLAMSEGWPEYPGQD
ncbi:MAG TPA: hypothetical protein VKA54_17570, partial [Gemmatimonadaceae bacterium]|nr:hypothetical protein [Gemmatimonadaceae bacterium]